MAVEIGISPIAWQNDDLPDLTAAYTMEQALREGREIGYTGVERGQRMPKGTEELRAYLDAADIKLCGGWCSGASLVNGFDDECAAIDRAGRSVHRTWTRPASSMPNAPTQCRASGTCR